MKNIFIGLLLIASLSSGTQSIAANAEQCLILVPASNEVINDCAEDIEVFFCSSDRCGSDRYFKSWENIPGNGGRLLIPGNDLESVEFGACSGSYFTAQHTATRSYTCTDVSPPEVLANEYVGGIPLTSASNEKSEYNRYICEDGRGGEYAIGILNEANGIVTVRARAEQCSTDECPIRRMNLNLSETIKDRKDFVLIDRDTIDNFLCASPQQQPMFEEILRGPENSRNCRTSDDSGDECTNRIFYRVKSSGIGIRG